MSNNYQTSPRSQYKYLSLISMIYITIMLAGSILTYKFVQFGQITMIAGSFLTPLWFIMADIVTEVYGYKAYRQLVWSAIICSLLFTVICLSLGSLPSPTGWEHQAHFDYIISKLPRIFIAGILGIVLSSFINSYVISKWKILVQGKYFWLRSVGASGVGELVFTIITMFLTIINQVPFKDIAFFILVSYGLKLIITVVFAFPSLLVAKFLKKSEGVDVYDYTTNYNPFRLS